MKTIRCVTCASEFADEEVVGHDRCPSCKSKGVPMAIKEDVTVKINWHELRILTIWASNYASQAKLEKDSFNALTAIISRLENQYPDKSPLTLMGEIKQLETYLRENQMGSGVSLYQGGEQVYPPKPKLYEESEDA